MKIVVDMTRIPFHYKLSYLWPVHWFSEHFKITYNPFDASVGHLFLLVTCNILTFCNKGQSAWFSLAGLAWHCSQLSVNL